MSGDGSTARAILALALLEIPGFGAVTAWRVLQALDKQGTPVPVASGDLSSLQRILPEEKMAALHEGLERANDLVGF